MTKAFLLGATALSMVALAGCAPSGGGGPNPEASVKVSNPAYGVDQLFQDPNGCTVYRFYDQGDYRYYIVGPGGAHMLPTTHTIVETDSDSDTATDDGTIDTGASAGPSSSGGGSGGGGHGGHR